MQHAGLALDGGKMNLRSLGAGESTVVAEMASFVVLATLVAISWSIFYGRELKSKSGVD